MKVKFITIICLVILNTICYEDSETLRKRIKFYKNIKQYSNSTIDVGYDTFKGLYCLANSKLNVGDRILAIPKAITLCPYYLFPFKYELFEAINSIRGMKETIGKEQKVSVYLLTYYLMYYFYAPKDEIKQYIHEKKLEHYYNTTEVDSFIQDSFPQIMLTSATMEKEHFDLLQTLGFGVDKLSELEFVFASVIIKLQESDHFPMLYSWISYKDAFIWAYAINMSRAMTLRLPEYHTLMDMNNKKLDEYETKNNEVNAYIGHNVGVPCLVPFVDLCNHYQPKYDDMRDKRPIILDTEKGYFINSVSADYNYGDEVNYTYNNDPSNLAMYMHYGFTMRNNIFNFAMVKINENEPISQTQLAIGKQIGVFDSSIRVPSSIPKLRQVRIKIHSGDKELINYARLKYLKGDYDSREVLKKLMKNQLLSFENEMNAWIWYYKEMMDISIRDKYNLPKSIKKAQHFTNKLKEIEANWVDDDENRKIWAYTKHYDTIYRLDISYKLITVRHAQLAINNIILQTYDEINNLKKLYFKN